MKLKTFIIAALALCASAFGQTLDQSSTTYSGGVISGLPWSIYGYGQTFRAGITGNMTRIDVGFTGAITNGTVYLQVYAGRPNAGGTLLSTYSQTVNSVPLTGRNCSVNEWPVFVPVVAGQEYTFIFSAASRMPYPYGIALSTEYANGTTIFAQNGFHFVMPFDLVFRTWVQ